MANIFVKITAWYSKDFFLLSWKVLKDLFIELFFNLPIWILYATVGLYAWKALSSSKSESIQLFNYSFVVVAALSGLCFAWAACLAHDKNARDELIKDKIIYSGERFFHSNILLLISILTRLFSPMDKWKFQFSFDLFTQIIILVSVSTAISEFYKGLHIISKYLWQKRLRHKDWNSWEDTFTEPTDKTENKKNEKTSPSYVVYCGGRSAASKQKKTETQKPDNNLPF